MNNDYHRVYFKLPSESERRALAKSDPKRIPFETVDRMESLWQPTASERRPEVEAALKAIPPDCGNDEFMAVGMAVISTGWNDAKELVRSWANGKLQGEPCKAYFVSSEGKERNNSQADKHFDNRFKAARPDGGIQLGSLFHIATRYGYEASRPDLQNFGDISNGRSFAKKHRGEFLYSHAQGDWYRYDGLRWKRCLAGEAVASAKTVISELVAEAINARGVQPSDKTREDEKHALNAHRRLERVRAMLVCASTEPGMFVADASAFDCNPYLLCTKNAVIDLRSGKVVQGSFALMLSRQAGAWYDPGARCDAFVEFLSDVFSGDGELVHFVQRALGYTLTGLVDEEVLFDLHGPAGANGKSVFGNIISALLGEYACTLRSILLTKDSRHGNEAERDKVRLAGSRLVLINEVGQADVFDDRLVKELVSRERIAARELYGRTFDFMPSHKIWLRANHLPGVQDAGTAFWRRVVAIPFNRIFSKDEQISNLDRTIIEKELSGILNWAIEGCLKWQKEGLVIPAVIREQTAEYQRDTDMLGQFLEECCDRVASGRIPVSRLYLEYRLFIQEAGMVPPTLPSFGRQLSSRGLSKRAHGRDGNVVIGLVRRNRSSLYETTDDL